MYIRIVSSHRLGISVVQPGQPPLPSFTETLAAASQLIVDPTFWQALWISHQSPSRRL